MTVSEALAYLDGVKPNAFSQAVKLAWLSEIEGKLALEVRLETPESLEDRLPYTASDLSEELEVGVPYTGVYTWWLQAQTDLANGEYDRARNTMALFDNAWAEYLRWYCQRNDPAQEDGDE